MESHDVQVPRKTVLAGFGIGAAAVTLAACSNGDTGSDPDASAGGDASAAPEALTETADVPVGSGVIVGTTIVTQPVEGDYKGFSAVCTHSGCLINDISDGTLNCPCHGSKFSLDGQVVNGPAARPLTPVDIEVQGDSIVVA